MRRLYYNLYSMKAKKMPIDAVTAGTNPNTKKEENQSQSMDEFSSNKYKTILVERNSMQHAMFT